MPQADANNPSNTSAAYNKMSASWKLIDDILAGPAAIRAMGEVYLKRYEAEGDTEYKRRLAQAPWQPEFDDILRTLASKPFGKEVALGQKISPRIAELSEDIDGKGNNLTAFARPMFRRAVAKGQHHILVDNTGRGLARTVAEERAAGVRPYWISIRAEDVLALYTATVGGREIPVHVRLMERAVVREGYAERTVERVRVLNRDPLPGSTEERPLFGPPTWQLFEKKTNDRGELSWPEVGNGVYAPLTEIPFAMFFTGEREGPQYARPPLEALADKQIELYRAQSRKDEIMTYAGSPMLSASGIAPPKPGSAPLQVGPKRILFAPPGVEGKQTGWSYIQPDAANLKEIREDVRELIEDIRRLGMQPLTQRSGGVTATASSIEGAKAHSTVEAWAVAFKDVIEQALVFTSMWLNEDRTAEVEVDTDFSVEPYAQAPLDALHKARERGDISRGTYWNGLRRFDVLAPDFDPEAEEAALLAELPDPDDELEFRAAQTA
jgi:hypothetical protein